MKFRDVVIKNFIWNMKQYVSLFLCSAFSITVFFIYATLVFNQDLVGGDQADLFKYIIPVTVVGISLFAIFFILYANSAFIKGRNKELGIYMTLGMDRVAIRRLVNWETIFISIGSLVFGIISGTLFSRIFQMVIVRLLELQNVSYHLDYQSYLLTIGSFVLIFGIVILRTSSHLNHMDINSLLKEARTSEGTTIKRKDKILALVGAMFLLLSIPILLLISGRESLNTNPVAVVGYLAVLFGGMYLLIARGGNCLVGILKKRRVYEKNLLVITRIHYKYHQNKRMLFILSVLSTMTILLVASPFSLFRLSESIAEMNPNDVEFIQTRNVNTIGEEQLTRIFSGSELETVETVPFVYLYQDKKQVNGPINQALPVISLSTYEKKTGNPLELQQGQCVNVVVAWQPGNHGIEPGSTLTLYGDKNEYSFQVIKAGHEPYFATGSFPNNGAFPSNVAIVVGDEAYTKLEQENATLKGSYRLANYKDWKDTKQVVASLQAELTGERAPVISVVGVYTDLKNAYAAFLFVCSVMGVLFFIAGGSVLYFRQYTELTETKATFRKLYKIGITSEEVNRILGKELKVLFFIPLLFGAVAGISLIYLITNTVGGAEVLREFMSNTMKVIGAYFLCQWIFYVITKKKSVTQIQHDMGRKV